MEIVNVNLANTEVSYQQYRDQDLNLINKATVSNPFGSTEDYVEYFIYDANGSLLGSNYFAENYQPVNVDPQTGYYTSLELNPESDVRQEGFDRGSVNISYNFFRKLFRSSVTSQFWIKEISGDRTEIRVCRQDLSNLELQQAFNEYNNSISLKAYYPDFYLNFGDNNIIIGVNVLFAIQNEEGCLLIKLYEPLPDTIQVKSTFWIVDKISDSVAYNVNIEIPAEIVTEVNNLRGPNFNIGITERIGQTTPLYNYSTLFSTAVTSSYQQLRSIMEDKGLDINVDYSDFSNFVHFSSATERIYNFVYKLQLIESYTNDIQELGTVSVNNATIVSSSKTVLQDKINSVIEKFDGYEYYLYYESGSTAWPKSNSTKPYTLYSVTSSEAQSWLGSPSTEPTTSSLSILYSASFYDMTNKDYLLHIVPEYLKQDSANQPYEVFLNMIGQHFDNVWIYLKDVTERFNAENNLTKGISKDLVGEALKGLGIKLYTNTNISDNLYYSILGINPDGSLLPPTGSEIITQYVTSSLSTMPAEDITLEYYKRIYHNLPYLLKTRGTERGLRALINCFGIPNTILRINEFGGSDKSLATPDLIQSRHALAYYNTGSTNLTLPWVPQNYYFVSASSKAVLPDTIEFRFKTTGVPPQSHISQSIFEVNYGGSTQFGVNLIYNSASAVPGSPYENYGDLRFYLSGSSGYAVTAPISLPFYDTDSWWSLMIQREIGNIDAVNNTTSNNYWIYVKSSNYNEEGNGEITFEASQSIYVNGATSSSYNAAWNYISTGSYSDMFRAYLGGTDNNNVLSPNGVRFQGYFQEFRYWGIPLTEAAFDEHVVNSLSYKSNTTTGSLFDLTFRLPLGSNLNVPYLGTGSLQLNDKDYDLYELGISTINANAALTSYHPAITGAFYLPFNGQTVGGIPSFISGSTTYSYGLFGSGNSKIFTPFTIVDLIPTPATGVSQKVNNKIEIPEVETLAEDLLSPHVTIQKVNKDLSKNSTDLEVGFSPADALDADITSQLGYFNIDEYIGAPSDAYKESYPDLTALRNAYFQKYVDSYDIWDFVRLIKYYDNSLFKMLKDYVPARANLSTGIIVKPHILERPKYARNEPIVERYYNYSGSIDLLTVSGSNPEAADLDTSYTQSIITPLGTVISQQQDLREPFTGEFSGSTIQATTGIFPQTDVSSITAPWTSSTSAGTEIFTTYSLDPLLNNVTSSRRSVRFLEPDYSSNITVPVNLGLITGALALYPSRSVDPTYTGLDSEYWPFSDVNDYNYRTYTRLNPRYEGSKVQSATYTTYTPGDDSYGKTAAIDKEKLRYAYLVDIYTASIYLPGRSNAQVKYLIDNDENTLNLTKANFNIFDVQNIFKSGETCDISLFQYDEANPYSQLLANNPTVRIYEGGFRYLPILHNLTGSNTLNRFVFDDPVSFSEPYIIPGGDYNPADGIWNLANWSIPNRYYSSSYPSSPFEYFGGIAYTAQSWPTGNTASIEITMPPRIAGTGPTLKTTRIISASNNVYMSATTAWFTVIGNPNVYSTASLFISKIEPFGDWVPTSSGSITRFETGSSTTQTCLYYLTSSNQIVIRLSDSTNELATENIYNNNSPVFESTSDPAWSPSSSLSRVVTPFQLSPGDKISLYNSESLGWNEKFEITVRSVEFTGSLDETSRILVNLVETPTINLFKSQSVTPDATTGANYRACSYIIWKRVPDETNVMLRYNPKDSTLTEEGLLFPQYIQREVKQNAGNVVQSLKANNLI